MEKTPPLLLGVAKQGVFSIICIGYEPECCETRGFLHKRGGGFLHRNPTDRVPPPDGLPK